MVDLEIVRENRRLHQQGQHRCPKCQRILAWTAENFHSAGGGRLYTVCKDCKSFQMAENLRQARRESEDYRLKDNAESRRTYALEQICLVTGESRADVLERLLYAELWKLEGKRRRLRRKKYYQKKAEKNVSQLDELLRHADGDR